MLLGFAVIGVLALAFFLGRAIFGGTDANIAVPDLTGLTHDQVVSQLTERGLVLGAERTVASDTVPAGHVVGQDPAQGVKVGKDTAVDVTYSAGPEQVTVPTLVGLTQSQALDALTAAGLVPGAITLKDSVDQPAGTVIAVDPTEGSARGQGLDGGADRVQREGPGAVGDRRAAGAGQGRPRQRRLQRRP